MNARLPRLSFRTRLSIIITVVFVAAGAGLLAVQYFVVQGLFASAVQVTAMSCESFPVLMESAELTDGSALTESDSWRMTDTLQPATGCAVLAGEVAVPPYSAVDPYGTVAPYDTLPTGGMVTVEAGPTVTAMGAVIQQTRFLSDEVVGGLLVWSGGMLVVFAGIAAGIASWLARRSLSRIGEVTAAARDISERDLDRRLDLPGPDDEIKELGDTIDGMLDRLQLAFAAQDRFVANASHELRTPLTTTRTALEIPLEQGDVPERLEPAIRRALTATEHSERLIAALLSLSRGRIAAEEFDAVELGLVATAETEELEAEARAQGITLHVDVEATTVAGDATLLARAVRNLLDNGIRHNLEGGAVWVRVGDAAVEVENTGEPLDEQTTALLTEPFYRGAASRTSSATPGIGLGLAIVESIAETHGGVLVLRPREGGGLVARLALPAGDA